MSVEAVRKFAMSLPHVTEQIQWVDHLLFKVGGKMFAVTSLSPEGNRISVKTTPEKFFELTETPGVVPAPYMARNHWVALETWDAIRASDLRELIKESYDLVFAKLPKKTQVQLSRETPPKKKATKKSAAKKRAAR